MNQRPYIPGLFTMPTEAELEASAKEWLEPLAPCLYENWPQAIKDLSFRTEVVSLTKGEIEALLPTFDGWCDPHAIMAIEAKIDPAARSLPDGFYPRLNSRSPKDSFQADEPDDFRCRTGAKVIGLFSGSMRMLDDLARWRHVDGCKILLREWHEIPKHQEWRCFICDGRIAGISQYFHDEVFPGLGEKREEIALKCAAFLHERVLPVLHLDTVVCDVWLREGSVVIEINPYGLADPCLFTYEELESVPATLRIAEAPDSSLPPF